MTPDQAHQHYCLECTAVAVCTMPGCTEPLEWETLCQGCLRQITQEIRADLEQKRRRDGRHDAETDLDSP